MDKPTETIEISQENAEISKTRVVTGHVQVRTSVKTIEDLVQVELDQQDIEITRVPIGQVVTARPDVRTEGELTIIPVVEEKIFVEKRLVLREELHIRRKHTKTSIEIPVTLRREDISVEHRPVDQPSIHERTKDE